MSESFFKDDHICIFIDVGHSVAVCSSDVQCVDRVVQCGAGCCSVLQCVIEIKISRSVYLSTCCILLQCVAVCCLRGAV